MPPCYDIYGLSRQREKKTVERFLEYFTYRETIEDVKGSEIDIWKNRKYGTEEVCVEVNTLTEVIDFGLENQHLGFAFYIRGKLKPDINNVILKFTFDGKMIFGVSIEEHRIPSYGKLVDNYDKAQEIEKLIAELTNSTKTSIQFEYAPSDDEEEFDSDAQHWLEMNDRKQREQMKLGSDVSILNSIMNFFRR